MWCNRITKDQAHSVFHFHQSFFFEENFHQSITNKLPKIDTKINFRILQDLAGTSPCLHGI
jgi:hypothetical protein